MNEQHIERAEDLLSYFEQHSDAMAYGTTAAHREWWMGEAATLLRDMLPEWSAFKTDPHDDDGNRVTPDWQEVGQTTP